MALPILQPNAEPTGDDLLRYFARAQLHWARHLGEEAVLDVGTAIANAALPDVFSANQMLDVSLPDGMTPAEAMAQVAEHFSASGGPCRAWAMNPAAAAAHIVPMVEYLLANGYTRHVVNIMHLRSVPAEPLREVADLKIIPARASFRHARALADEFAATRNRPGIADARMLHLDDSHTDALVAIRDGVAAASVAVLAVGDVGMILELFVAAAFRRQGIGRTMMSRALEICARSLFKHVLISAGPMDDVAIALYERCGFRMIGRSGAYRAPG